ncbi:odorant receptor 1a-like [Haematobia irritans]|uniref:odorant receptor 1a-like n=1 Tax=Haematobia irritans TaxID=7368 RepID=UPI003F503AAB
MYETNSKPRQNLEFLRIQHKVLSRIGLDIGVIDGKDFLKNRPKFLILIMIAIYLEIGLITFAVNQFSVQIGMASGALSMFNQGLLLLLKMGFLMFRADDFLKLIWDMNLLASLANETESKPWLEKNRFSCVITKVYLMSCYLALFVSIIIPIPLMLNEYFKGEEVLPRLPFYGEFPFEDLGLPIFIMNFTLSALYGNTLLCLTVGIDTLLGWIVHAISGHHRILCLKIAKIAAKFSNEEANSHEDFIRDIGNFVRYHNRLLDFIDDINSIFGPIFWAEVSFSCLQMCFVIFNLNSDADIRMLPFNIMVFTVITMQLVIYCFGGQMVKTENENLFGEIYSQFPWEKLNPTEKKMLLLPLMRSQANISLRGLFFELDRNLLVYVFRTAFSYNTLLGAMKDK